MKLSKATFIFLAVGIFVILAASLGMTYSQRNREQSQLKEELALAQQRLKKYPAQELSSQKKELESQLAKAESQLKAAKDSLYKSIESIETTDALFKIAKSCNVEVTGIRSPGVTTQQLEGVTLSSLPLTVTVEGNVLNLIDFVSKWTEGYQTGAVKSVEITVPEPPEEKTAEQGGTKIEEQKPSAIINVFIYTYEGG